jgi:hypothetical protein
MSPNSKQQAPIQKHPNHIVEREAEMDLGIKLGIIGIILTTIGIFVSLNFKRLWRWLKRQNKLRIEKLPRDQTHMASEIITLDPISAVLILPLRIVNPTDNTLTITEVQCIPVSHPHERLDLIPPLTPVTGIDQNQILDLRNVPLNKAIQPGSENVYLVRRCEGTLANARVTLRIVIKDHRNKRSRIKCDAKGIFLAE